jgi:hypothetical protein
MLSKSFFFASDDYSTFVQIRLVFEKLDTDHNDFLSRNEIKEGLECLGHPHPT